MSSINPKLPQVDFSADSLLQILTVRPCKLLFTSTVYISDGDVSATLQQSYIRLVKYRDLYYSCIHARKHFLMVCVTFETPLWNWKLLNSNLC